MLAKDVGLIISTDDLLPDDLRAKQRPRAPRPTTCADLKKPRSGCSRGTRLIVPIPDRRRSSGRNYASGRRVTGRRHSARTLHTGFRRRGVDRDYDRAGHAPLT